MIRRPDRAGRALDSLPRQKAGTPEGASKALLAGEAADEDEVDPPLAVRRPVRQVGVADLPMPDTEGAVDELEWTRWLESEPRGYSFVARIAREVVLRDMLTAGHRRRLEARVKAP